MSSTRRQNPGPPLRQERFLSSHDYVQGLEAYPVARRCEPLSDPKERAMIWWLQEKSHQEGGLGAVTAELIRLNPESVSTPSMRRFGMKPGQIYDADQVRAVRAEIPDPRQGYKQSASAPLFPLRGEHAAPSGVGWDWDGEGPEDEERAETQRAELEREAASYPQSYPASIFLDYCRDGAAEALEEHLRNRCRDPKARISNKEPWYFHGLHSSIAALMKAESDAIRASLVRTQITRKVHRCLDIARKTNSMVLISGRERIGKSHGAETWCKQHPGRARIFEVPPNNDEMSFFRALARCLKMGDILGYKLTELRERVDSVLTTGQLMLIMDEAHRLWPQRNLRYGFPARIEWLMTMVNKHVPIVLLTTSQFFTNQRRTESTGWASGQFTGRITHYEQLPSGLAKSDIQAVAQNALPEASGVEVEAIVAYARSSEKYLAAIDAIACYSRYLAGEDGRTQVRRADIQRAMREGVIPSDRSLASVMNATAAGRRNKPLMPLEPPIEEPENTPFEEVEGESQTQGGRRGIAPRVSETISAARHGRAVRPAGHLAEA